MEKIIQIDYARCLNALLRKLPLALATALLAGIIGSVVCFFALDQHDEYTARASAFTHNASGYGNAAEGVQYAEMAKSLTVAEKALEDMGNTGLNVYDVYNMIEVQYDNESVYVNSSAVINIYATSTDAQLAIDVANAVANAFVEEVSFLVQGTNTISVFDIAMDAQQTYNARNQFITIISVIAATAFFLVCLVVVLLEVLSLRLITIADGSLYGKLDIIGVIPDNRLV